MKDLPAAITVGRLLSRFQLKDAENSYMTKLTLDGLSIRSLNLIGAKTLDLPLPGSELNFACKDDCIWLEVIDPLTQLRVKLINRGGYDWANLCEQIEAWIEREQGRILADIEQRTQLFLEHLSKGQIFHCLKDIQHTLGIDVFLINSNLDVLAWTGGKQIPLSPIHFRSPKKDRNITESSLSIKTQFFRGEWKEESYRQTPLAWYPICGQQGVVGYLGIAAHSRLIGSVERLLLHKIAVLLLFELGKIQTIVENERLHHRDFLFDLLYNNFDSMELIKSRGKIWGWDFSFPHLVMVGKFTSANSDSIEHELMLDLVSLILKNFSRNHPKATCMERNDQVIILFPVSSMLSTAQCRSTAEGVIKMVKQLLSSIDEDHTLIFGLGNLYESAKNLHRSFQEAKAALELGKMFGLDKELVTFLELGVLRLIHHVNYQELEDFRSEMLHSLLDFDQKNNLELEQTLLAFFICDGDLNKAAKKLFLHPNTLRYRLKKAGEVLGINLTALQNQFNIYIALMVGRLNPLD